MRAKVKTARRKASKLHGATAGYVSLVDRGANETPFKMVKSTEGVGAVGIKKRKVVEAKSHKKLATGKKAADGAQPSKTIMAKMLFDQDHFTTEQEVRDWIKKAEWDAEDVVITDDGDGSYVARPADTTDESFTRMAKVDAEDAGVEAYVGEMLVKTDDPEDDDEEDDDADDAEDDDDDADDDGDEADITQHAAPVVEVKTEAAPVKVSKRASFLAKAKSSVTKFDGWDAHYSKKSTLSEALEAGMAWDATPPGFYDVQSAFNGVVQTILGDDAEGLDKKGLLAKAAADYADILVGLDNFFDAYIEAGEDYVMKSFDDAEIPAKIEKWAKGYAAFVTGEAVAPTPVTKTVVTKAADPATAIDHKSIAEIVAKAMAPVMEKVDGVTATVTKMSERRPTKKAADLSDSGTGQEQIKKSDADKTDDWLRNKQRKSLMGG